MFLGFSSKHQVAWLSHLPFLFLLFFFLVSAKRPAANEDTFELPKEEAAQIREAKFHQQATALHTTPGAARGGLGFGARQCKRCNPDGVSPITRHTYQHLHKTTQKDTKKRQMYRNKSKTLVKCAGGKQTLKHIKTPVKGAGENKKVTHPNDGQLQKANFWTCRCHEKRGAAGGGYLGPPVESPKEAKKEMLGSEQSENGCFAGS